MSIVLFDFKLKVCVLDFKLLIVSYSTQLCFCVKSLHLSIREQVRGLHNLLTDSPILPEIVAVWHP